jgi:immune inhibitor A
VRSLLQRRIAIGATCLSVAVAATGASMAAPGGTTHAAALRFPAYAVSLSTNLRHGLEAGHAFTVHGVIQTRDVRTGNIGVGTPAQATLRLRDASGRVIRDLGVVRSDAHGRFAVSVPGAATAGLRAADTLGSRTVLAVDAARVVGTSGTSAANAGTTGVALRAHAKGLRITNSFVSHLGWVTPGQRYPFLVRVLNPSASKHTKVKVTLRSVSGMALLRAHVLHGHRVAVRHGRITWHAGTIGKGTIAHPTAKTLVVTARARTLGEDPRVAWKNIATTAVLRYAHGSSRKETSHGPRVVPPGENYASARFGDRPFPVVPVDYLDFQHTSNHPATKLDRVINGRSNKGSTYNLYQEMSLRQLFPHADIPSAHIASATYKASDNQQFTTINPSTANTCHGVTLAQTGNQAIDGQPRIKNGWYQLPGQRDYYGDDGNGSAIIGAETGVGQFQDIDAGCGPTGKLAYDAAVAADPDIDYSDFDTDKDGVVDFFEVIFEGLGGNGDSQINGKPPYDNVWPHSSSLLDYYVDPKTGLTGYISHDQLKDLEGHRLWYTNGSRTTMTRKNMGKNLKVFVRVGPYNVNPETAIDKASVISHEYGHSLGAPDYYSTGSRATYGDFMLMADDKSQNVSAFQLQDWGWVVPQPLRRGTTTVKHWTDTKKDTHTIHWRTPSGKPYTLHGPRVHNATVYTAKLPGRKVIDPAKVRKGATRTHVWWSQAGNDFGCGPNHGHNLDIALPELQRVKPGTKVTLSFDSAWEAEWDFDYGFVQIGIPNAAGAIKDYTALKSQQGYTTPRTTNPNQSQCEEKYSNGLTGSSTSWKNGTEEVDRRGVGDTTGLQQFNSYPDFTFVKDSYDISALAGKNGVVRFSYATDPGLAKAGWFIDDIKVTAGNKTIWKSNFEKTGGPNDSHIFNGGCKESLQVAPSCTHGWEYLNVAAAAPFDHGYYLSMRDRSGFDANGHGQNDRDPIGFHAGLLLEYTDEAHGYGNVGVDDPPAQSPLDSHPSPGNDTPDLNDATFRGGSHFSDKHWVDNYTDPSTKSGNWEFNYHCLAFRVTKMKGTNVGPLQRKPGKGGNLVGNVKFTIGKGCAPFDYGFGKDLPNQPPVAKIQVKPRHPRAGHRVTFNGSASYDDRTTPSKLRFRWDFDGDGKTDATGATVHHTYRHKGTYRVRLTVRDQGGLKSVKRLRLHVAGKGAKAVAAASTGGPGFASGLPVAVGAPFGVAALAGWVLLGALRRRRPVLA